MPVGSGPASNLGLARSAPTASTTKSAPAPPRSPPEYVCRADFQRYFAAHANGIDGDDSGCAGNSRALNRAQSQGTASNHGNDGPDLDVRQNLRRGATQAGHGHAATNHAKVGGRGFSEYRHHPFLECDHQLGESADVRIRIHRRAVAHIGDGNQIAGALAAEKLAHIGAPPQALIARAALRSSGYANAIAHLNAPHLGTDSFHDSHAAVALNQSHARHCEKGGRHFSRRSVFGRRRWEARHGKSEHVARIRIAEVGCLGAHYDLTAADGTQRQILQSGAAGSSAARDPCAKFPARCGGFGFDRFGLRE